MGALSRVALLSDDLIFRSQLDAAVRSRGGRVVPVKPYDPIPEGVDLAFVDLNGDTGRRLGTIAGWRDQRPGASIVGFCHHGDDATRRMAMHVGASQCIANGALQAAALRIIGEGVASTGRVE